MTKLNARMLAELDLLLWELDLHKEKLEVMNEDIIARFERIISHLVYELKKEGFFCGLKVVGTDEKKATSDHAYSRKAISDYLLKRHIEKEWTKAELIEKLPKLLTSIMTTSEINSKLQAISRRNGYKLEDYIKMEHYKSLNLSLEPSNKMGNLELITDDMRELMESDQIEEKHPFYKFFIIDE